MNKAVKFMMISAALVGFLASGALAQRNYDPKTVETAQGKVISVEKTSPPAHPGYGVHLMLKTPNETIAVHLGPAWFWQKQKMQIAVNDVISVTGSRVTMDGKPTIITAEIKKGDEVVKLRDRNGLPVWSGRGRGR
jgi:hypothetical protein